MHLNENPLTSPTPEEVSLQNPPLVRVLTQIRFPLIIKIETPEFINTFQQAVKDDYPILRQEVIGEFLLSTAGASNQTQEKVWRFLDETENWRLSLAQNFLALETTQYKSREDFLERLKKALIVLEKYAPPSQIDRIGIRYIDRISGNKLAELHSLIKPEILGPLHFLNAGNIRSNITETVLSTEEGASLIARWGKLPANGTIDKFALEPLPNEESWILDLDMFTTKKIHPFSIEGTLQKTEAFAKKIYTFFRWVTTESFIRAYGGKI